MGLARGLIIGLIGVRKIDLLDGLRGHPFMTSTRKGRGQAQVDACGRGGGG